MLFDFRPILLVIGALLSVLGAAMFIPALLDLALGDRQWRVFASSGGCDHVCRRRALDGNPAGSL